MADANKIESAKVDKVQVVTERLRIPFRGFIESETIDKFNEQVVEDMSKLSALGNGLSTAVEQAVHIQGLDKNDAHQKAIALEKQLAFMRRMMAKQGYRVSQWHDFHSTDGVSFIESADNSMRAAVAPEYGQVTVPMNSVESRTYSIRLLSGGTVVPSSVIVTTTGTFDKLDGDGELDYEHNGTVEETDPRNCVNGNNDEFWRRRVIFDLEDDVSEVEAEITIQIPASANLYANVIYTHPYPLGNVDITGVWTSVDLSDSFTLLPGFTGVDGASKTRWFMVSQKVAKVKVRIRQRNWFEENGKKVFEYGFQEVGVLLVDWDKTYDESAESLASNHTVVKAITADEGFSFHNLYGFYSDPDFTLESAGSRHLHFIIAKDPEGNEVIWDSDVSGAPQDLAAPVSMGDVDTVYVIATLNWCDTVPTGSPFYAGTTPYLTGFGIDCSYAAS